MQRLSDSAPAGADEVIGTVPELPAQGGSLKRTLTFFGVTAIVLSAVSPASSVFTIVPTTITGLGSGALLAFGIATVIAIGMAFCWAELGTAFSQAGGDYVIVTRVLGPFAGFVDMVQYVVLGALIPAVFALGIASFLAPVLSADARLVGAIAVCVATVSAILDIRTNAWLTGVFLLVELAALALIVGLGLAHPTQPASDLLHPQTLSGDGLTGVGLSGLLAGVAVALFAYNGYGAAMQFGEEITGPRRTIARAVLWGLAITIVAEALPLLAVLVGTPSTEQMMQAANPISYVVEARAGETVNTIVSLAVAAAVLNALIALILELGRGLFGAGRDQAFPPALNRALSSVHPRTGSPWIATMLLGAVSLVLVLTVSVETLITVTGAGLTLTYGLIATSALVFRIRQPDHDRQYAMPLWPLWPLLALAGLLVIVTQQPGDALLATGISIVVSASYYLLYLRPRRGRRWIVLQPTMPGDHEEALR